MTTEFLEMHRQEEIVLINRVNNLSNKKRPAISRKAFFINSLDSIIESLLAMKLLPIQYSKQEYKPLFLVH
jgi:hypothetical protein